MASQNKGGNLSNLQITFSNDILSSYQMILQLDEWNKQFGSGSKSLGSTPGSENTPAVISPMILHPQKLTCNLNKTTIFQIRDIVKEAVCFWLKTASFFVSGPANPAPGGEPNG